MDSKLSVCMSAQAPGHAGIPLTSCTLIEEDCCLLPNDLQAVIQPHGSKLVHPHTIVVGPDCQGIRVYQTYPEACSNTGHQGHNWVLSHAAGSLSEASSRPARDTLSATARPDGPAPATTRSTSPLAGS